MNWCCASRKEHDEPDQVLFRLGRDCSLGSLYGQDDVLGLDDGRNHFVNQRKLDALRALAARPGTEAEGALARAMLARLELKADGFPYVSAAPESIEDLIERFADRMYPGTPYSDEIADAMRRRREWEQAQPLPTHWTCSCGVRCQVGCKCSNTVVHDHIQMKIRERFKKGDRVFYNRWAYPKNDPGTVTGYLKPKLENGDHPWAWLNIKFDRLKSSRQVPIVSSKGWHLSHNPLSDAEAKRLGRI